MYNRLENALDSRAVLKCTRKRPPDRYTYRDSFQVRRQLKDTRWTNGIIHVTDLERDEGRDRRVISRARYLDIMLRGENRRVCGMS